MNARPRPIHVLVADDQALFREMFEQRLALEPDIQVVGGADSGAETLAQAMQLAPDVLLLDIQLGDTDGITITQRLRAEGSTVKVLLLTGFHSDELIYRSYRAGAAGYISKDASFERVLDAVRRAHAGDALLEPVATTRILREFEHRDRLQASAESFASHRAEARQKAERLTAREREILACIADGLSNQEIAERLFISEYTVKKHVSNLFRKIGVNDRVQAVLYALEIGVR